MIRRVAILVAAGLVLVIGSSWACLAVPGNPRQQAEQAGSWPRSTPVHEIEYFARAGVTLVRSLRHCEGSRPLPGFYYETLGASPVEEWLPRWAHPRALRPSGYAPCGTFVEELACGWPRRALLRVRIGTPGTWQAQAGTRGGLRVHWPGSKREVRLPVRPIWSGLLLNTALYAIALAALLWAHFAVRSALRLWRGRCPSCAFMLRGGTGGCPECGWRRGPGDTIRETNE